MLHDPALVEYVPGYENSLHGSPTFQEWATALAAGLVGRHDLEGGRAVEIGGGRGEFMDLLVDAGLSEGLVMDPSAPDDAVRNVDGVTIERRLFEQSDVDDGAHPTRLLLTRHVLEHLADPSAFVGMLGSAASTVDAGVYIEVPNGLWTIRDLGIWDIIYEHCSYFTPGALGAAMTRAGARDVAVEETFGGQFLSAEARSFGAPTGAAATASDDEAEPQESVRCGTARDRGGLERDARRLAQGR